jgi:hypothetical protein
MSSPAATAAAATAASETPVDAQRWHALVAQIGQATAEPLTAALERVTTLASTGRIDRIGLTALVHEIETARRAGIISQQLARLASGGVRQTQEKTHLTRAMQDVLTERQGDIQARGLKVKTALRPTEVIVDATLLFGLLNALIDWMLAACASDPRLDIEMKSWPSRASLVCRFRCAQPSDHEVAVQATARLDDLSWHLLEQTAATMGLGVERSDKGAQVQLALEFPRTVNNEVSGLTAIELDDGFANSVTGAKPLAGSHVLVIAARRDVRVQVRDAIRNMGLIVDFVNSVEDAVAFCKESMPNAIIVESVLRGERFDDLVSDIYAQRADFVFIEIIEEGNTFEISGFSGSGFARVGRDAILESLPSALVFELSKGI